MDTDPNNWRPSDFATYHEYSVAIDHARLEAARTQNRQLVEANGGFEATLTKATVECNNSLLALKQAQAAHEHAKAEFFQLLDLLPDGSVITVSPLPGEELPVWHWAGSEYYEHHEVFRAVKDGESFGGTYLRWDDVDAQAELHSSSDTAHSSWVRLRIDSETGLPTFRIAQVATPENPTWSSSRVMPFRDAMERL